VLEVHEIHGHCDLLVKVRTKGLSDLRDKLVKQVRSIDEVSATEAYPVMRVVKEDHSLPILAP
jgi:DNA-binding Lrp family transcriptional regulator